MTAPLQDLVALVADKDIEMALTGILSRSPSLGIRHLEGVRFEVDPEHDPGCFRRAHELLRSQAMKFRHALVMFDHEGCGQDHRPREELEGELEERLASNGWARRAAVIVISPEIEQWVWSSSPEVERVLGWSGRNPTLRPWLATRGLWPDGAPKPSAPKRAMELALREARKPRSSSHFRDLAASVGFKHCTDPAFLKLTRVLREWFGLPH